MWLLMHALLSACCTQFPYMVTIHRQTMKLLVMCKGIVTLIARFMGPTLGRQDKSMAKSTVWWELWSVCMTQCYHQTKFEMFMATTHIYCLWWYWLLPWNDWTVHIIGKYSPLISEVMEPFLSTATHCNDFTWVWWHLKSQAAQLFDQQFGLASRETSKFAFLALYEGNAMVTSQFPSQRPVTWKLFPCHDIITYFLSCRITVYAMFQIDYKLLI